MLSRKMPRSAVFSVRSFDFFQCSTNSWISASAALATRTVAAVAAAPVVPAKPVAPAAPKISERTIACLRDEAYAHLCRQSLNDALAKMCGLSLRAFERHFQATYRTSPHDYVRQMRVRMSCDALVHSLKTLAEVAFEYGFSDQSHFTREFRSAAHETRCLLWNVALHADSLAPTAHVTKPDGGN